MTTFLRLVLFIAFFAFTILVNLIQIDLRFDEIRYLLGTIASTDQVSNTFGIVARYELIKRRMQYGEDNNDNYELEARMQALTSQSILDQDSIYRRFRYLKAPVKGTLNGIRYLLGKPIINPKEDDRIYSVLEIGYFYERVRKYSEALKYYDEIMATGQLKPEIKAAILIHKAFCMSMIGRYDHSKRIYEQIINEFTNTEAGVLSWKLLNFLNSMEEERKTIYKKKMTEIDKAKQFYLVMDFRNAIKNYSVFLGNVEDRSPDIIAEARYFKGRSHEELGETEDAIMEYRAVIKIDTTKKWAKQANRRMLMLGEFYEQQKNVAQEAKRKLELYQDQLFSEHIEKYTSLIGKMNIKSELLKKQDGKVSYASNDSIMKIIDQIGTLSFEDSISSKDVSTRIDKNMLANSTLSSTEIIELRRKRLLAENQFRRPSILKRSIDEYSTELRFIYNKRLRREVNLSGNLLIEIEINANGAIGDAAVIKSTLGDEEFEQSIITKIKKWKFKPIPDSLGTLTIRYPFEFFKE